VHYFGTFKLKPLFRLISKYFANTSIHFPHLLTSFSVVLLPEFESVCRKLKDFILRSVRRKERSVPRSNRLKLERLTSRRGPRVAFVMFWLGGASLVFLTFLRFCKYLKLPHWTGLCSMPGGLIASLWVCQMDETMGGDQRVLLCQQLARPGRRWSITS